MQDNTTSPSRKTRRELLKKTCTGALGVISIPAIGPVQAGKGSSFDEVYRQARKLRQKTGKQELFRKHLKKHGYRVITNSNKFDIDRGGFSTQAFQKSELSSDMTLTYEHKCVESYGWVDYSIEINAHEWWGRVGDDGPDELTLSWNDDHYRIVDDTWYHEGDNISYQSSELNGVDWEFFDVDACKIGCNNVSIAVGTKVRLYETNQERAIRGSYYHTWSGVEFSGFSVSTDGSIGWSFAPDEHSWEGKYETRDDSQADEFNNCF